MHGRPKLGKHRMVTVATRVEPDEVQHLRNLAEECGMSLCGYLRELIRKELSRAARTGELAEEDEQPARNGTAHVRDALA